MQVLEETILKKKDRDLKTCQAKHAVDPRDSNITELEINQSKYDSLCHYIIQGNIVRSKVNWHEQGEK